MNLLGGCSNRQFCIRKTGAFFRLLAGFLLLLLLLSSAQKAPAASQIAMTDIRVGLAALYGEKSEIKISNSKIGLGYCINDSYQTDLELSSSTGFVFTPASGYYYSLAKTYSSYANAERAAAVIRGLGVSAWPVAIYRNYWRVYPQRDGKTP